MGKQIQVEIRGAIVILTLSNLPLNLLNNALKNELYSLLEQIKGRQELRALVLTGEGERAFSAGADMKEFARRIEENTAGSAWEWGHRTVDLAAQMPQVLIAGINGQAFGGGLEVAMMCDIILCSDAAKVGLPEVKRGIMPGNGGVEALFWRCGYAKAVELLTTGRLLSAQEALAYGVVDQVHPADKLLGRSLALAEDIAASPGLAVSGIKATLCRYKARNRRAARKFGSDMFAALHQTTDCAEGVSAFFEKRDAVYTHR